jgi:hypothetical protein
MIVSGPIGVCQVRAIREKTASLKALRLAKDARAQSDTRLEPGSFRSLYRPRRHAISNGRYAIGFTRRIEFAGPLMIAIWEKRVNAWRV